MNGNLILNIRAEIKKYFDERALIADTEEIHFSPSKEYFFKTNFYCQTESERNWTVAKIEIYETNPTKKLFEFIRNDDSLFYEWLTVNHLTYLLLSEDIEGKSIFDFTKREFYSYSFEDDKFIWCEFYPSPDGRKLAIVGCNWACPYEIRIFDTSNPAVYPYKELYKQESFKESIEWLNENTIKITSNNIGAKVLNFE